MSIVKIWLAESVPSDTLTVKFADRGLRQGIRRAASFGTSTGRAVDEKRAKGARLGDIICHPVQDVLPNEPFSRPLEGYVALATKSALWSR